MIEAKVGDIVQGTVIKVFPNFAILQFDGFTGLLHISELSDKFIRSFVRYVKVGNIYTVKIISIEDEGRNVKVSLKRVSPEERAELNKNRIVSTDRCDSTKLLENLNEWLDEE